jgi:hypothetical protein
MNYYSVFACCEPMGYEIYYIIVHSLCSVMKRVGNGKIVFDHQLAVFLPTHWMDLDYAKDHD